MGDTEPAKETAASQPRSDWAAVELERRRLAEGFRSGFDVGATVVLEGLKSAPALNGKRGTLQKFDSQALRWFVELEDGAGTKSFNPSNLVPNCGDGNATKRQKVE